jgi:hypothetical protein
MVTGAGTLRSKEVEVGSASPIQGAELTANVTAAASSVALDCFFYEEYCSWPLATTLG